MVECLVNETPTPLGFAPETWGDLLQRLEDGLIAGGHVVTAVRFDGVEQPSFRSPELATAGLGQVARIDIDAADAATLLCGTLDTARASLPALRHGARDAADAFRRGAIGAGHEQVAALVQAVQSLMLLTAAIATAAEAAGGRRSVDDLGATHVCQTVERALEQLIARQSGQAWPAVADALDELGGAVADWGAVLDVMRAGVPA